MKLFNKLRIVARLMNKRKKMKKWETKKETMQSQCIV